jgi:hypothetical protein
LGFGVSEWATTDILRTWLAADDFSASVGREVDPFSLFAIIVADVVRVLFFHLKCIKI